MTKYPIYPEDKARELLRYLPEGISLHRIQTSGTYTVDLKRGLIPGEFAIVATAEEEANGHLPPGFTAAAAGMVAGKVERITIGSADYYGGPQDVRTIEPEPVDALVTHLLIEVSK